MRADERFRVSRSETNGDTVVVPAKEFPGNKVRNGVWGVCMQDTDMETGYVADGKKERKRVKGKELRHGHVCNLLPSGFDFWIWI